MSTESDLAVVYMLCGTQQEMYLCQKFLYSSGSHHLETLCLVYARGWGVVPGIGHAGVRGGLHYNNGCVFDIMLHLD